MLPAFLLAPLLAATLAPAPAAGRHHEPGHELKDLRLVKSVPGTAVVRLGVGPLVTISVGDRLGRHRAEVKEIDAGRVVLEESFTGTDGRPDRALIVLEDGRQGGMRFLTTPGAEAPAVVRPVTIEPGQTDGKASRPRPRRGSREPDDHSH